MSLETTAHLNFHGKAREALTFYQSVFGGELTIATYGDLGMPQEAPDAAKVVFGQVVGANGFRVMAYDVPGAGDDAAASTSTNTSTNTTDANASAPDGAGESVADAPRQSPTPGHTTRAGGMTLTTEKFFLSLRAETAAELDPLWTGLRTGATIVEPLAPSPWSPAFGMLTDRFGVTWILDVSSAA